MPWKIRQSCTLKIRGGATGTSDARKVDCMRKVIGLDSYNLCTTGAVARTLASARSDCEHLPCVLIYDARGNGGGGISPTIMGDHQNRITDYTAIIVEIYEQTKQ